jgi:hypothetical protein
MTAGTKLAMNTSLPHYLIGGRRKRRTPDVTGGRRFLGGSGQSELIVLLVFHSFLFFTRLIIGKINCTTRLSLLGFHLFYSLYLSCHCSHERALSRLPWESTLDSSDSDL